MQMNRKLDARKKIQIGGLVIKADLGHLFDNNPATLLGALIEIKESKKDLNHDQIKEWRNKGLESLLEK